MTRAALAAVAMVAAGADAAWAHADGIVRPADAWRAWSAEPAVLIALAAAAWLYARGMERLWRRAGTGRGVRRWQAGCFAGGLAVLFIALVSPLDALGGTLFAAHMVQHELLVLAAAPLLVLGAPLVPFTWALPPRWRVRIGGWGRTGTVRGGWAALTHPATAWTLHAAAVWTWHAPALYQATLRSDAVHAAQHGSFLGTALLFWWVVLGAHGRARIGRGAGVLFVFSTAVQGTLLGALLTFSSRPWYPAYAGGAAAWGTTPLADQQAAGLVMWIPGGIVYLAAVLWLFAGWLREGERRMARRERMRMAGTVAGVLALALLAGCGGAVEQDVLDPRGDGAARVARLWWVMLTLGTGVFLLATAFLLRAVHARRTAEGDRARSDRRAARWVAGGIGGTLAIVVGLFVYGLFLGRADAGQTAPADALTVEVVGYRFWWEVRYPDPEGGGAIVSANEVHLPAGRPVRFRVWTEDVIHSFWMPNLHGKIDMLPGRVNEIVVRAREPGVYRGQCAEFCGIQHALMAFPVVVHAEDEFDAWLRAERGPAPAPGDSLARRGAVVFRERRCAECHAVRGTAAEGTGGPDLTRLARRLTLAAGTLPNTRGHLGGWIANPQRVKPGNNMPHVPMTGPELRALLAYLETLR